MRILAVLAVASLALTPALAPAATQSAQPAPGGVAGRALTADEIPYGAVIVGGLVFLGAILIGVLVGTGSKDSTTTTNGPTNGTVE